MKERRTIQAVLQFQYFFFIGDYDSEMTLLWVKCWCPLLQGIARFCCDARRETRMAALTILQRALLAEDLQSMNATEWENCFNQVVFLKF